MTYKAEPYVVAADVYSNAQHNGRGGWTWYTGSASWMYAVAVRQILGFKKEGSRSLFPPVFLRIGTAFLWNTGMRTVFTSRGGKPGRGWRRVCTLYVDGEKAEWVP
jgi:hypothetical protein